MERLAYVFDTNAVADYLNQVDSTSESIKVAIRSRHFIYLCYPVIYETQRGLIKVNAKRKATVFEDEFVPQFITIGLLRVDWEQAAQFWADAVSRGKQHSDVDLLVAAIAKRLDATVITADDDFDSLPVKRENWRQS